MKVPLKSPGSPAKAKQPLKPRPLPGPTLSVTAFVDLMRKIEPASSTLSNDQVRFVQLCVQRYQHDQQGIIKTKLAVPTPKKSNAHGQRPTSSKAGLSQADLQADAFLERLTNAATEDDVMHTIETISDADAERMVASQGLRCNSPAEARQKLLETALTLRQMSRIQHAGKAPTK
ncbi:MAG TPA: hypothetical protein VG077_13500 [Verrucomicrobiae bacterium]|nr:hypothetical protein [Verrucomicrobiae bacterium]